MRFGESGSSTTSVPQGRGWAATFDSLKVRSFLYLWLGMLAMMASVQMQMLARGFLVYDITDSPSLLGLVSAGSAVPILVLSLIGGAVADRLDRKRVIQVAQAVSGIGAVAVGVAISTNVLIWHHLFIVAVVQGGIWAFLMPARQAIIPQLVGQHRLSNAVALNTAGMSAMTLASPAIGGALYAWQGPAFVYYTIAVLTLAAVVFTTLVPATSVGTVRSEAPLLRDILAGLSYIRATPLVMVLLVMGLVTTLLAMPLRFLMPVFVVDIYNRGPDSLGLLLAAIGAGSLVGSMFVAWLGPWRRGMVLISASFLTGVSMVILALFPFYLAAAAIMVLIGLGDAGRRSLNMALVMEVAEDAFRGRVMSVFMMNFGLMPLGVLPMAIVADLVGAQVAVGLFATLLLVTSSAIFTTQRRLREMK